MPSSWRDTCQVLCWQYKRTDQLHPRLTVRALYAPGSLNAQHSHLAGGPSIILCGLAVLQGGSTDKTLIWATPRAPFLSTCLSRLSLCLSRSRIVYYIRWWVLPLGTSNLHQILRLSCCLHFVFLLFQKITSWTSPSFCSETMSPNPTVSGGFSTWPEIGYTIRGPKRWSWWSSMTKSAPRVWASWLAMGKETCNDQ